MNLNYKRNKKEYIVLCLISLQTNACCFSNHKNRVLKYAKVHVTLWQPPAQRVTYYLNDPLQTGISYSSLSIRNFRIIGKYLHLLVECFRLATTIFVNTIFTV